MLGNGDHRALRQGDIISGVPFPLCKMDSGPRFLGTYRGGMNENVQLNAEVEKLGRTWYLLGYIHSSISSCAVLSQDCDLDPKQNPPPPSFVLCRLTLVPDGIRRIPSFYEALRENGLCLA